ncbi:MAG: hypothetical protein HC929_22545 [Leptolyngbyaceae cyanobacterium SM2_5_2]|nr:hypothetical protein [Leptolyngbyaceae cyanobacterium SM2_5_2]
MRIQNTCAAVAGVVASLAFLPGALAVNVPVTEGSEANLTAQTRPAPAMESCMALQEVTTGQNEVRKRIENRVVTRNNWHTDWLVPNNRQFSYFVAIITAENTGPYQMDIHLRLPQGGSEPAFTGRADVTAGTSYVIPFQSPTGRQPSVINTRVGGVNGNFYTLSVAGCETMRPTPR